MNKVCDEHCDGCIYMGRVGGDWLRYCRYIFENKEPRPFPSGKGCVVKETKRRKRRAEDGNME